MAGSNSSTNITHSDDYNYDEDGKAFPVAETTAAVLCFITVILAVSILILIIKRTRRRVIILKPPDVNNPHYNHLSVISNSSMKRLSLKRLSGKFRFNQKIEVDVQKSSPTTQIFPHTNLPHEARHSLTSITSINIIPSLSGDVFSYKNSKESLLSSNGPQRECYFSIGSNITDDVSSYGEINASDAISYEVPERYEEFQNTYSKLTVPSYNDLSEEGVYVPSEDDRNSNRAIYDHFESHRYNKLQFFEQNDVYWQPASTKAALYSQLAAKKYREILRKDIIINDKLGSGNFASVYQGVWNHENRTVDVAIKILKTNSTQADKVKFLQEAAIMGQFLHKNIVRLLGVVTIEEPTMIVLELFTKGDLLSYLRKSNPTPEHKIQENFQKLFLRFAREVAAGMEYLSSKSFIHRDIAARNILLNQQLNCKIGDFGMARDLINEGYYKSKGGKMPIKWTAPEALLYKKFSIDSDVWSYGILLYEIWSLGGIPFMAFSNSDMIILAFSGLCHPPAPGLPRAIYRLMVHCWNPDHSDRPKFSEIVSYFSQSDSHLLFWTEDDLAVSPMVNKLGVSHHESIGLYKDLQTTYKPSSNDIEQFATSTNLRRGSSLSTIPSPRILKTDSLKDVSHFK